MLPPPIQVQILTVEGVEVQTEGAVELLYLGAAVAEQQTQPARFALALQVGLEPVQVADSLVRHELTSDTLEDVRVPALIRFGAQRLPLLVLQTQEFGVL
jgi:hypothetical protein